MRVFVHTNHTQDPNHPVARLCLALRQARPDFPANRHTYNILYEALACAQQFLQLAAGRHASTWQAAYVTHIPTNSVCTQHIRQHLKVKPLSLQLALLSESRLSILLLLEFWRTKVLYSTIESTLQNIDCIWFTLRKRSIF
jgi:hypothetical protein